MGKRPARDPSQVLIVEGADDQAVAESLLRANEFEVRFTACPKRSVDALIKSMGAEIKVPGRRVVGFVFDANSDPHARWQEVVQNLEGVRPVPEIPEPDGAIIEGSPKVGIWMMPDNIKPGELEDLVAEMVRRDDAVWPLAEAYLDSLPDSEREYIKRKPVKAAVHVWLANKKQPGRMGAAIGAGHLDVTAASADRFASWLRRLFDDASLSPAGPAPR